MKRLIRQFENKVGFTIVELLTVMSIIVILIGLLVPALNMAKRYATDVKQRAQFHGIDVAMQLFSSEFEGYPDSYYLDDASQQYPGAARLCEAMVGQDLLGFHPASRFMADCTDGATTPTRLYDNPQGFLGSPTPLDNLQARRGPYLQLEKANAYKLEDIYDEGLLSGGGFDYPELFVLCDEYARVKNKRTGKKIGMPILYYKANLAGTRNPTEENGYAANPGSSEPQNIYDYKDNDDLVDIGIPWMAGQEHPMDADQPDNIHNDGLGVRETFYFRIHNEKITITEGRPYRADSYILISAGFDGQYGTRDDIFNFEP